MESIPFEHDKWLSIKSEQRKQLIRINSIKGLILMKFFIPLTFIIGVALSIFCIFLNGFSLQLLAIHFMLLLIPCIILIISLTILMAYLHCMRYYFVTTVAENRTDCRRSGNTNYNEAGFYYKGNMIWKRYDLLDGGEYKFGDTVIVLSYKPAFCRHFNYLVKLEYFCGDHKN